jgi:signal peptidase II
MQMADTGAGLRSWLWGAYSRLGLGMALVTLVLDQAHKWWMVAVQQIEGRGRIYVLPFLDWHFVKNVGISYGLFALDGRAGQMLLASFAFAASIALTVWMARGATSRLMALSLGLIVGGAVGNAIDRLVHGGVVDYMSLHAFGYYWYVFNIADVAIVAGVIGLLYDSLVSSRNDAAKSG